MVSYQGLIAKGLPLVHLLDRGLRPKSLLRQLINVYVQLLLEGDEAVRNMRILVPGDILELHGDGKGLYKILDDAHEVCMRLPLLQLPFRVVSVADDSLAVSPCPQLWRFVRSIELRFDVQVHKDFLDYCQESNRPQEFSSVIVRFGLQFGPATCGSSFCGRGVENKGARARALMSVLHVRAVACHIECPVEQGVADPPSIAVALEVVPQLWLLACPQGAWQGVMRLLGGCWLGGGRVEDG